MKEWLRTILLLTLIAIAVAFIIVTKHLYGVRFTDTF